MLKNLILVFFAICLIGKPFGVGAQKIRFYNSEQGLPNSLIHRVSQDARGYIWLATENGACYFDGVRFTSFYHDRSDVESLSSDLVKVVFTDSRGNCWVGTSNGLQLFDNESNSFRDFPLEYKPLLKSYYISSIVESPDKKKLFVSVAGFGLIVVDAERLSVDHETTDKLLSVYKEPYVGFLLFDSQGNLWSFAQQGTFIKLDYKNMAIRKDLLDSFSKDIVVSALVEDTKTGNMLIGTYNHGLFVYDRKFENVRAAYDASSSKYPIRALLTEKSTSNPDIWVGTEGFGLKKFDRQTEKIVDTDIYLSPVNLDQCKIHALMQDDQGNIWAGIFQKGLIVIPASSYEFEHLRLFKNKCYGQSQACATSIVRDLNGNLWVGTDGAGLFQISESGVVTQYNSEVDKLPNNSVQALAVDKRGTLWISTYMGGITTYNSKNGFRTFSKASDLQNVSSMLYDPKTDKLFFGTLGSGVVSLTFGNNSIETLPLGATTAWVYSMCVDSQGVLWVGSSNGVRCFDPSSGGAQNIHLLEELEDTRIYSILEDSDGAIFIGTDNGIIHIGPNYSDVKAYSKKDGLPSNLIGAILQDLDGNIWISTSNGLVRFDPKHEEFKRFYSFDGLQDNEFHNGAAFKDVDGKLYFGGINGVSAFYPQKVESWNKAMPNLYFSQLLVLNEVVNFKAKDEFDVLDAPISRAKQITLEHSQNVFTIEFSVLEFSNPQRVVCAYMMKGFDTEWQFAERYQRSATYTNLPDGTFTFMVKAFYEGDVDGNNMAYNQIDVLILPPWYKTWWAYSIYFALIALLFGMVINFVKRRRLLLRERQDFERKEMLLKMYSDLSQEIRTPLMLLMNPLKSLAVSELEFKRKEMFDFMFRNAQRILQLINQLMDMRKIDNHELRIKFNQSDLIVYISDIMKSLEHFALARNVDLRLISPCDSLRVWFDQSNLEKVIYNVLTNALNFSSDNGYVPVYINTLTASKHDGFGPKISEFVEIRIVVSNSVIHQSDLERVFDRDFDGRRESSFSSGIGLYLAKMIVQLHHGTMFALDLDHGVAFIVRLPLGQSHFNESELSIDNFEIKPNSDNPVDEDNSNLSSFVDVPLPDESSHILNANESKSTVVFLNDNVDFARYLRSQLSESYHVELCHNAADAWEVISTMMPDAVIADLSMPQFDGISLCQKIRQNIETKFLPVIILASNVDEACRSNYIENGADGYLIKPVSLELLKSTLSQVIQTQGLIHNKFCSNLNPDFSEMQMISPDVKLVSKVIETIRKNIENPEFSVDELSRQVGLSRVHLNRKLKENINISPNSLIKSIRLKQAAYLLIRNKVNISDVAYKVGFSSHSYFSINFRNYFGMSPSEFVDRYMNSEDKEVLNKLIGS